MIRLVVHILLLIVLAIFISFNVSNQTTINLFGRQFEGVSVIVVVLLSVVLGILYSFLIYLTGAVVRARRGRERDRAILTRQKEQELLEREQGLDRLLQERDRASQPGAEREPGPGPQPGRPQEGSARPPRDRQR